MREMKDSGIEWIKEIPTGWTTTRGKNILQLMKRPPEVDDEVITCFRDGEVTLRRNRREEGFTFSDKEIGYQGIKKGDLVIHGMDGFAGAIGISDSNGKGSPVLVVCTTKENSRYLVYYLRTLAMQNVFLALATGIRERSCDLRWNKIADLLFPLPGLDEQCRIADYLDRKCRQIDTIIARQQEVIEKLKTYKLSVITEAVTKGLNPDVPMKDSGEEWIGEVPGNWTKVKLKNICQFINGDRSSNYPSPNEYVDDGIPFLGADSLCGRYVDITQSKKIAKAKYHSMGGAKIRKGDILYTLRGSTIGKNAMATFDEGTVASSLMVIRPISLIPEYLLYWLNSEEEFQQRQSYINGSTAPNLSAENVGSFVMFLPSAVEQREIADYLDTKCAEIELTMLKKQMLADQLSNYKKSLIYEVVTGKKEV